MNFFDVFFLVFINVPTNINFTLIIIKTKSKSSDKTN